MIFEFAKPNDIKQLSQLWGEAFGDDIEFIHSFYKCFPCSEYAYIARQDNEICAMVHLLPLTVTTTNCPTAFKGGYVYALATKENYRNQGIAAKLLKEVEANNDFLFIIPANKQLESTYRRHGFDHDAYRAHLNQDELPQGNELNLEQAYTIYSRFCANSFAVNKRFFEFARSDCRIYQLSNGGYSLYGKDGLLEICSGSMSSRHDYPYGLYKVLNSNFPKDLSLYSAMMLE